MYSNNAPQWPSKSTIFDASILNLLRSICYYYFSIPHDFFKLKIFLCLIFKAADGKCNAFYLTDVHFRNILVCCRTSWGSRFEENGWKVVWTSGIFRPVYEPFSTHSGSNMTVWCYGRTANCRKNGHRSSAVWSYKRTQVAQLVKWKWDNSRR